MAGRNRTSIGLNDLLNEIHDDAIEQCSGRGKKHVFETNAFNGIKPSEHQDEVFALGLAALVDRKWRTRGTEPNDDEAADQPSLFAYADIDVDFVYLRVPDASDPSGYLKVHRDVATFDDWDQQLQVKELNIQQASSRLARERRAYAIGLERAGGNRRALISNHTDGAIASPVAAGATTKPRDDE